MIIDAFVFGDVEPTEATKDLEISSAFIMHTRLAFDDDGDGIVI
jgi:hypothetical protein